MFYTNNAKSGKKVTFLVDYNTKFVLYEQANGQIAMFTTKIILFQIYSLHVSLTALSKQMVH